MALPGFTADASLRPNAQTYRVNNYFGDATAALSPQQFAMDEDDGIDIADDELDEGVDELDEDVDET